MWPPVRAMHLFRWTPGSPLGIAALGSALVGGQYVAGKAARDALFLANFETSSLPAMIMMTAIFSIGLVMVTSRALRGVAPVSWVPTAFAGMAVLMMAMWALAAAAPTVAAPTLYLVVSGFGPLLGSGFWLMASERFDPHTAKQVFGQIAGAGTLGGILGGLGAAQVAAVGDVGAMLPLIAGLNLACAWSIRRLARPSGAPGRGDAERAPAPPARSGLRVLAEAGYLRNLAALILLGTIAAIFVDQAFKTEVKATFGSGPRLGTFFSLYYAALSLVTFVVQTGAARYVLERFGLAMAAGTPALAFLLGGTVALLAPGLRSMIAMRASESVLRASIYRTGYEVFYTPLARSDKRAVKAVIDVGIDRTGDIIGAAITRRLLWIPQPTQATVLLALAMGCAGVALLMASRVTRGYAKALEASLLSRRPDVDLSEIRDLTTRTTMLRALGTLPAGGSAHATPSDARPRQERPATPAIAAADIGRIMALQSGDPEAVRRVLRSGQAPSAALVPHVIALLAWDDVSEDGIRALRAAADTCVGTLCDALGDPGQPFAVRRRLARVFAGCGSQRAADGLMLGLEDLRFEVRYQSARSLLAVVEKHPAIRIDPARILACVTREIAVNRTVWESRRLLDGAGDSDAPSFLEDLVRDRASHSLAHVFTLLALVLPAEPLRIAFHALHTDDEGLRGTALEYLDSVLPHDIRDRLWPFLEAGRQPAGARPREETLAALLRSHDSIRANLEDLKRRAASARAT